MGLVQGLKDEEQPWQRKGEIVPRQTEQVSLTTLLTCHEGRGDARREEAAIAMKVCIRKGKGRESELVAKRL